MKKITRSCIAILIVCILTMNLFSCVDTNPEETTTIHANVIAIEKYGHAVLDVTTADFISAGYDLGDVVCVSFKNCEYIMPFYDGYYSNPGSVLLRGLNAQDYIAVCINYGDFSATNNVSVGDTAKITMSKKTGMLDIQELYSLQYSNNPNDYADNITFANFREVTAGRISSGKLYRTASPINDNHGRAKFASELIESVNVKTVLNLADSNKDIEELLTNENCDLDYYRNLYESGNVYALDLSGNFFSKTFAISIAEGLTFLSQKEPPYCIHCTEGKDRAGFTAMILEALMGATLDEIINDYMLSFYNYYGIDKEREPQRYQAVLNVNLMEILSHVTGESIDQLGEIDLEVAITSYLIDAGMTQENILALKEKLK